MLTTMVFCPPAFGLEYFSHCYDTRVVTTDDVLVALA